MGLIIAASITTALALCGLAILLVRAQDRHSLLLAFIIALPLEPLSIYLLRAPLDGIFRTMFGIPAWIVLWLAVFYAPLTEEPAKWLTAAVPAVQGAINRHPVAVALAVGIGFGIGELWFLAYAILAGPNYQDFPFWVFRGFIIERLEVCFLHGAFVALPFVQLARGKPFWYGGLAGMGLHLLANLPIFLAQVNLFGLGDAWKPLLNWWIVAMVVACGFMVCRLSCCRLAPTDKGRAEAV